jgi:RNA polymerase sigma factor (sigma-70 family)
MFDSGDDEYSLTFREAYPRVFGTVKVIVRDRGRAEELTQDAFVQLYANWSRISHYERPEAWVRRVAIRMAVRHARREAARPRLELAASVTPIERVPDLDVRRAIEALPPAQRATVALFYLEDLPIEEIVRLLGSSRTAVKVNLHKARTKLAEAMGEQVEEVDHDVG